MSDSSEELMLKAKKGDLRAFETLIWLHQKNVVNFFVRSGVESDAEDLAQDTFIRLWDARARYEVTAKFKTFLYLVMRRIFIDEVRRRDRRERTKLEIEEFFPDRVESEHERDRDIDTAKIVSMLPDGMRDVILMIYMEGLKHEEVADRLSIPVGTVKSRVFNALRKLRKILEKEDKQS